MIPDTTVLEDGLVEYDEHLKHKDWQDALAVLDALPPPWDKHPQVVVKRLDALIQAGLHADGLEAALKATHEFPKRAELWHRLGCLQCLSGQLEEARASIRNALALEPALKSELMLDPRLRNIR